MGLAEHKATREKTVRIDASILFGCKAGCCLDMFEWMGVVVDEQNQEASWRFIYVVQPHLSSSRLMVTGWGGQYVAARPNVRDELWTGQEPIPCVTEFSKRGPPWSF